jgi:hypothetical protein
VRELDPLLAEEGRAVAGGGLVILAVPEFELAEEDLVCVLGAVLAVVLEDELVAAGGEDEDLRDEHLFCRR